MSVKKQGGGSDVGVAEPQTIKPKLDKPRMYRVLLHNDHFTPREFVVLVLQIVFAKTEADATTIMLYAHTHGYVVAGVYTREIAETKVAETMALSTENNFPLLCTMEPDEDPKGE